MKKFVILVGLILFVSTTNAQIIFDIDENDHQSMINAISGAGMQDDQICKASAPIVMADINNNGLLDYITSLSGNDFLYVYFDQEDFTAECYYPHEGPNLIITGALHFGSSFTTGDFNSDNIADILVGAQAEGGDGEAYVIFGNTLLPTTGTFNVTDIADIQISFSGFSGNPDYFGSQVCALDINNDGYDDICIGATVVWFQGDGSGRGSVYVIYGRSNLPSIIHARTESDIVIEGDGAFDHIGKYLCKGDFDNDNFDDLVFTSPHWPGAGAGGQRGKAWILFGSSSLQGYYNIGQTYSDITSFAGQNQNDEMAYASSGDINGDGIDDLILTAGKYDRPGIYPSSNNFGKIYINYGPVEKGAEYNNVEDYSIQTQIYPGLEDIPMSDVFMYIGSNFGQSVATLDINIDGYDDILIGAPGFSRPPSTGSQTDEGGAFLILGDDNLGDVIYEEKLCAKFLAHSGPTLPNISFGRAVTFIIMNNSKTMAVITDVEKTLIYLFNLPPSLNIEDITDNPSSSILNQNYPNPFNKETTISYQLPKSSIVTLSIYNTQGQILKTLVNQHQNPGFHNIQWDASNLNSGIYFYRIHTDDFVSIKKCFLVK